MNEILNNATSRMEKSISSLGQAFNKIRTGRANPAILDDIKVDYYGNLTVLSQTSSISVEDGRSLVISPWDKSLIPEIEKAISNSNLGLNPSTSSDLIRILRLQWHGVSALSSLRRWMICCREWHIDH